jgi:hypothetical protein
VNAVCLLVAGVVRAALITDEFTLGWEHSVEKTRWEETYRIDGDRLRLTGARIQGLGAGMEPPQGAILRDGWWTWTPTIEPIAALRLTQSTYTSDWILCWKTQCRKLAALAPAEAEGSVVELVACGAQATPENSAMSIRPRPAAQGPAASAYAAR